MSLDFFECHKEQMRVDPAYKSAWDALEQEFQLARALIRARTEAGMTQAQVACAMGVKQPVVARMESGKNVSVKSLRRYASAVGRPIPIVIQPLTDGPH